MKAIILLISATLDFLMLVVTNPPRSVLAEVTAKAVHLSPEFTA
jgi:hypothetical protein